MPYLCSEPKLFHMDDHAGFRVMQNEPVFLKVIALTGNEEHIH